ncbi:MAG TPA: type I glyceraldehyde-3-phosphate dehydrogenase [Acidimicrobiales bacterium]|nr:type I glyceraldehyde-3-phosphate dehydrogenase [Acidimicrobiales bacterium]
MVTRVGINGFGRIGRNYLRASLGNPNIEIVAVNDLVPPATNAHLLKYDSTHGRLNTPVSVSDEGICVGEATLKVLAERNPSDLPWAELGVDVVIESTGHFTSREGAARHLEAGAKRVIISAPSGDADAMFVVGVNEHTYDPEIHFVVSNASCTTNCFVPMVKVLDDALGVDVGLMTTVHSYTNDQHILDLARSDGDLRRARAAAINIVPSTTGAARATSLVMASMKGRLDGTSLRVPTPDGSITDFTAIVRSTTIEEINAAFKTAAEGSMKGVIVYTEDPIVSSDIVGSAASCTFDSLMTMVLAIDEQKSLIKVFGWYDNEWGYSSRLVDLTLHIGQ